MADSDPPDIFSDMASLSIRRELRTLFCDPCFEDGDHLKAEGFCVDCAQHLCLTCFQHHRTPKPFRKHQLLDKQHMPQTKPEKVYKDECTDTCITHKDKTIEYYCEDHQTVGCCVCMNIDHRSCTFGYIPNLSADLFNSEEYKAFKSTFDALVQRVTSVQNETQPNLHRTNVYAERILGEIGKFRKQIDQFFDMLEQTIRRQIAEIRIEDQENMTKLITKSELLTTELQELRECLLDKERKGQKCQLFVDIKQLQTKINQLKTDISALETNNPIRHLIFRPSDSITSFISNQSQTFGSLLRFHKTIKLQECNATDISVVSGGRIAVYDSGRNKLGVVSDSHMSFKTLKAQYRSHHRLKYFDLFPVVIQRSMTTVSDNEIASLCVDDHAGSIHRSVEFYSVKHQPTLQKSIETSEPLDGSIAYSKGQFINIPLIPNRLLTLHLNGDIRKTFPIERNLFDKPRFIVLNPDHTLIYVSDEGNNTVTSLTLEGRTKARYRPSSEWDPRGVAVSRDGVVYVCDIKNNNIRILTSGLKEGGVIPGDEYGIRKPCGLAYCRRERKLYVGMLGEESIVVLDI